MSIEFPKDEVRELYNFLRAYTVFMTKMIAEYDGGPVSDEQQVYIHVYEDLALPSLQMALWAAFEAVHIGNSEEFRDNLMGMMNMVLLDLKEQLDSEPDNHPIKQCMQAFRDTRLESMLGSDSIN